MDPSKIIETISDKMVDVVGVRALFLSGSHGNGKADEFSDIDFLLISETGPTDEIANAWKEAIGNTGEIILWWDLRTTRSLINVITEDWTRIDLNILKPEQLKHFTQHSLKPVFDHDNGYEGLPEKPPKPSPSPTRFKYQVEEFMKIVGLLYLVDGRKEYLNGVLGVFHLRNILVELLIEETAAPDRGGVLHLNRLITDEQKELLKSLPAPVPERDAIIEAHLAYAAAFLPRARKRAAALGMEWPEAFETATWKKLEQTLSIKKPY